MYVTKPGHWWTSYWRLHRRMRGYEVAPRPNDIRMAGVLLQQVQSLAGYGGDYVTAEEYLREVIAYGRKAFEDELARRKAEARMGA